MLHLSLVPSTPELQVSLNNEKTVGNENSVPVNRLIQDTEFNNQATDYDQSGNKTNNIVIPTINSNDQLEFYSIDMGNGSYMDYIY